MSTHEMQLILAVVKHYMDMNLREKVAREVPEAYNAWVGNRFATSVHNDGKAW